MHRIRDISYGAGRIECTCGTTVHGAYALELEDHWKLHRAGVGAPKMTLSGHNRRHDGPGSKSFVGHLSKRGTAR